MPMIYFTTCGLISLLVYMEPSRYLREGDKSHPNTYEELTYSNPRTKSSSLRKFPFQPARAIEREALSSRLGK
jgi:hypothetical protein